MFSAKANFRGMYVNNLQCDYCGDCLVQTQQHLLEDCAGVIENCPAVADNITVEHDDIFGAVEKQLEVAKLYVLIQETIDNLKNN